MNKGEHGALGSNAPLARVPVEEPEEATPSPEVESAQLNEPEPKRLKSDDDVVYLREDLRPR